MTDEPLPDLKPCPFCGDLHARYRRDRSGSTHYVQCGGCGSRTPICLNQIAANKAWNRRSAGSAREVLAVCYRRAQRHAADRKRIEGTPGHESRVIYACIAAEDEALEIAQEIERALRGPGEKSPGSVREAFAELDATVNEMLEDRLARHIKSEHLAGWIDALEHVLGIIRLRALRGPGGGE